MSVAVLEEKKKAIARRFLEELWGEGKLATADQILTSNFIDHDPSFPQMERGPAPYKRVIEVYRTAFPDLTFKVEDLVAEDNRVALRFIVRGTHKAALMRIPATGKKVNLTGSLTLRLTNDKISECWSNWDALGMLEQLGVVQKHLTS